MPVPATPIASLSENERKVLESIVCKRTNPQRLVERARIILLADENRGVAQTARRLGLAENTVRQWRSRWQSRSTTSIPDRLADEPRSGAPARITPEQICRIIAMSCEPPEKYHRPITHWTQQELADEAVKQGIVASLSQRSVGRFLKSGKPQTASRSLLADTEAR